MSSRNSTAGQDSDATVVKIIPTTRSKEVWEHYDLCLLSNGKEKARCKKCGMFLGKDGNSTLRSHTTKTCPAVKGQSDPSQPNITPDGSIFIYNNDDLRESFCKFVIQEGYPFNHFDNPRLTRILREKMQPQYRQVSRTSLRRDALKYWDIAKKDMQLGFLNIKTGVSLTCDVWSSAGSCPKSYLCVTAHWIDPSTWVMNKRVIAFELFAHPHTGARLFAILVSVIETYNLRDKIFSISFDNASNNTAAAKRLIAKYKPILDGSFFHTRCVCHIINLAVQDGLKMIDSTIEKFKTVLTRVFGKNKATMEKYRKFAISINVTPYSPHWDCDTRWSSTCMMFESLTRQRIALQLFYDTISKGKNPVSDYDWDLMEEFVEMLKVFKQSTTFLSGVYYPTSPLLLNELWLMSAQLERFEQRSEIFVLVTRPMRQKLVKYFKEMPPLFTCAAALNPCINVTGVEALITKISMSLNLHKDNSNYIRNQINIFNDTFTNLFDIYATKYGNMSNTFASVTDSTSGASGSGGGRTDFHIDLYNYLLEEQNKRARTLTPSSELGIYMGSNFLKFMSAPQFKNLDLLAWWREKEAQFPILSVMARDLLTVQASTVASESAFSFSGRVLSKLRTNLTPVAVEVCVCLKDYLDSVERIQHLASLEGPLSQNVEPEIMDEEYAQGLSTPPEDEDDDDEVEDEDGNEEYGIDETPSYLRGG